MINKNFLNTLLFIIIIFITWNIFIYSIFSFVLWELNPQLWSETSRFMYSVFGGFVGLFVVISIILVNNE